VTLPNKLTSLRIVLIIPFLIFLEAGTRSLPFFHNLATVIFIFACLTDVLDGWLARRNHQQSYLGSIIDPLADKLLTWTALIGLTFLSGIGSNLAIPIWFFCIVLFRDVLLALTLSIGFYKTKRFLIKPNRTGKYTAFFLMSLIVMHLFGIQSTSLAVVQVITTGLIALSLLHYAALAWSTLQSTKRSVTHK
jgi:CDP-diacylglycerol--glycerol-3-phosphate 3-phosphatidyltransferase